MRHVLYVCDACCEKKQFTTETPQRPPTGWWVVTSKRDNPEPIWKTHYACREDCKTEVVESVTRENRGFGFELRVRYVR